MAGHITDSETATGTDHPTQPSLTKTSKKNKKEQAPVPPPPPAPQCNFWLKRKNRFCPLQYKVDPKNSNSEVIPYCQDHRLTLNLAGSERVPCPYDPRHGVFPEELERHKKTCNQRPANLNELYYVIPDINVADNAQGEAATPSSESSSSASATTLKSPPLVPSTKVGTDKKYRDVLLSMSKHDFLALAERIRKFWDKVKPAEPFPTIIKKHPLLDERLGICQKGKHAYQVVCIFCALASVSC
jgi:tRNA:m4X modification enzyme